MGRFTYAVLYQGKIEAFNLDRDIFEAFSRAKRSKRISLRSHSRP